LKKTRPIATARKNAFGNETANGVASEGSFGSHPSIFIASADDEFLIFIDTKTTWK
jgi:hypothetical protein